MRVLSTVLLSLVMSSSLASTKDYMHVAFDSMISLTPYLNEDRKFTDPKEEEKIFTYIDNLSMAFKGAHGEKLLTRSNYSPSLKVMRNHIEETKIAFSSKQKYFAKNRLKATQALCMSCHSQLKTKASKNVISTLRTNSSKFKNEFERAEVLYLLRDYPSSVRYYLNYIDDQLKLAAKYNVMSEKNISIAFKRIVHLYTKTFFKPKKAYVILDKYSKNKKVSPAIREELDKWSKELKGWSKDVVLPSINSVTELERKYLANTLNQKELDINEVTLLVSSGRILQILNMKPKSSEAPLALYWLGRIDRLLNFSYYYSMADVYLMDCMEKFPKHPIAKRCFKEYKSSIEMGYTGSAGMSIPKDLSDKLKKYEQLIGNK